jgi:hypothetical protein
LGKRKDIGHPDGKIEHYITWRVRVGFQLSHPANGKEELEEYFFV